MRARGAVCGGLENDPSWPPPPANEVFFLSRATSLPAEEKAPPGFLFARLLTREFLTRRGRARQRRPEARGHRPSSPSGRRHKKERSKPLKRLAQLVVFLIGIALLVRGFWQMSRPVGYIAAGLALGVLAALSRGTSDATN